MNKKIKIKQNNFSLENPDKFKDFQKRIDNIQAFGSNISNFNKDKDNLMSFEYNHKTDELILKLLENIDEFNDKIVYFDIANNIQMAIFNDQIFLLRFFNFSKIAKVSLDDMKYLGSIDLNMDYEKNHLKLFLEFIFLINKRPKIFNLKI